MLQSLLMSDLRCLSNQGGHWTLVLMRVKTEDLQDSLSIAYVNEFHETDQLARIVGTENFAAVEVSTVLPFDRIEILSVMPEFPALTNRCLIVNCFDACNKVIIENRRSDLDSLLRCLPRVLARLLGKRLPPSFVVVSSDHRRIVKFELTVIVDERGIDRP